MRREDLGTRAAFTLLEVVFVIVILGVVSSIGAEIIAQVYESYITQRASHRSSIKTELAATQIANRLAYAIPGTVIGRKSSGYKAIDNLDANDYPILQWIAYDADSFSAYRKPGWSGFADLDACTATTISTPGSDLAKTDTIIKELSEGAVKDLSNAAIFFPGEYNAHTIGYDTDISGLVKVSGGSGENLTVASLAGKTIKEHYKLAWTSYAIVPSDNGDGTFDLTLRYNFQPWNGSHYGSASSVTLLRNVSVFKFTGSSNTIRFKICQQENIGETYKITTCKEKAVIR
jgi:prepilin-type N-terminal cleavage/methylation domain-containing protein